MLSDGNILRFLYFLFFIFFWFVNLSAYSANFENKNKRIFLDVLVVRPFTRKNQFFSRNSI